MEQFLFSEYKTNYLEYEDVQAEVTMLGVHFDIQNNSLNYTCYYNQELLENHHSLQLDRTKSRMYPFQNFDYSPYGFSVQIAVESQLLNTKYDYKLGRLPVRKDTFDIKLCRYHISFYMALAILATLNQILISKLRTIYNNTIRQIYIKDVAFYCSIFLLDFIIVFITIFLLVLF